jgi:transcriptional regulator with XRE-family HTH domain
MPRLYPLDASVAQSLAQRRRALGWSQNDLALAAGLTEGAIAKYETLRCPVPPSKLDALERALAEAEVRQTAMRGLCAGAQP